MKQKEVKDDTAAQARKLCPWCKYPVKMVEHPVEELFAPQVMFANPTVYVPECAMCTSTQLYVVIDAANEEEAFRIWTLRVD